MVAPMWAEEQELQGRTSRPRIVSPARQRWATPDVLDGIGMWHDDQPSSGPRRGVPSSRSRAEVSGLPAKHAAALAGLLRPVDIGVGALSRGESAASSERAVAAAALHAVPGMWDEPNCDTEQRRPAPGTYHPADLLPWRRTGWSEGERTPSRLQARNAISPSAAPNPPPATGVRVGAGRAFIRPSRGQAGAARRRRCAAPRRPPAAGVFV